jgi:hypothetical protein
VRSLLAVYTGTATFLVWPSNGTGRSQGGGRSATREVGAELDESRRFVLVPNPKLKVAEQCREVLRFKHDSLRTERSYLDWIERYVRFCQDPAFRLGEGVEKKWRHPRECGEAEMGASIGSEKGASNNSTAYHRQMV